MIAPAAVPAAEFAAGAQLACLRLRDDAVSLVPAGVPVTTVMPAARAPRVVVREIERGGHDVVVISGRPATATARWPTTFAGRLARRCPVVILVVSVPRRNSRAQRARAGRGVRVGAALPR